jgi:N-acetylated-alpha-linked acidic dipeptidase
VLPYDVERYAQDTHAHLDALEEIATERDIDFDPAPLRTLADEMAAAAAAFTEARDAYVEAGRSASPELNQALLQLSRALMDADGLQSGGLHRSLYVSPDPFSGYASWMLPGLRYELETDASALNVWMTRYEQAFADLTDRIDAVTTQLQ